MKKVNLVLLTSILNIAFASAYTRVYGSLGNFSLTGIFSDFNVSLMILCVIFIIIFAAMNFAVGRIGLRNEAAKSVIALIISVFALYGIIKMNISIEDFLYNMGLSQDLLATALPIIFILALIFFIWKIGFGATILFLGAILILLAIFDLVYQQGIAVVAGIIFIIIGSIFWWRRRKKLKIKQMSLKDQEEYKDRIRNRRNKRISGIGRGMATTGKYGWKGTKAVGRGAKAVGKGIFRKAKILSRSEQEEATQQRRTSEEQARRFAEQERYRR